MRLTTIYSAIQWTILPCSALTVDLMVEAIDWLFLIIHDLVHLVHSTCQYVHKVAIYFKRMHRNILEQSNLFYGALFSASPLCRLF